MACNRFIVGSTGFQDLQQDIFQRTMITEVLNKIAFEKKCYATAWFKFYSCTSKDKKVGHIIKI
jgi:hypothetical protein